MSDLILRSNAIDALKAIKYGLWEIDIPSPGNSPEYREHHNQIQEMMGVVDNWIVKLSDLPSAQPDYDLDGYSSRLWKAAYERGEAEATVSKMEQVGDCIIRQAAIKELDRYSDANGEYSFTVQCAKEAIKMLPTVDLFTEEPPNWKHWRTNHGYMWLCPSCGLAMHSDFDECVRCGKKRPSAEPEWKKGKGQS